MPKRPNILIFIADQQRNDTLGFMGATPCRTPNIDALATDGVSFDRAITPSPLCLPARAAMFTGLYPHQNHMQDNPTSALETCTLLDTLRANDYRVDYAGKWHMGSGNLDQFTDRNEGDDTSIYSQWCLDQGLVDGWTFNHPECRTHRKPSMSIPKASKLDMPVEKTNDAFIADIAIDMLKTRDRNHPFCLVCGFNGPHPPFKIPEPYFGMYELESVAAPANFGPQAGEPDANRASYYRSLFNDHGADFDEWRASYAVYWGFTSLIDTMTGRVLQALDEERLSEDTIVLYVSDHGEMLGAHGLWHKMVAYEEAIRVPMILRYPGAVTSGLRLDTPASLIDVTPTLLSLADLPVPEQVEGMDLSSELNGATGSFDKRTLFCEHKPLGPWMQAVDWRMAQADGLKYVWNRDDRDELYDLKTDPFETRNAIDRPEFGTVLSGLRRDLGRWMADTRDPLLDAFRQN